MSWTYGWSVVGSYSASCFNTACLWASVAESSSWGSPPASTNNLRKLLWTSSVAKFFAQAHPPKFPISYLKVPEWVQVSLVVQLASKSLTSWFWQKFENHLSFKAPVSSPTRIVQSTSILQDLFNSTIIILKKSLPLARKFFQWKRSILGTMWLKESLSEAFMGSQQSVTLKLSLVQVVKYSFLEISRKWRNRNIIFTTRCIASVTVITNLIESFWIEGFHHRANG